MPARREIAEQCSQLVAQLKLQRAAGVSGLRTLRRVWSRHLRAAKGGEVLRLVQALIDAGVPRWFAYELAHHHRGARAQLTAARLRGLGRGLAAWDEVDPFAAYLLGPAWREGLVSDAELLRWARSKDLFKRRSALVATVALNNRARGGTGDAPRTLLICSTLVADREDMVVKALSWALRELSMREPQAVRAFIHEHETQLAARVLREARSKLRSGLKNPKRR
ncbi:MAG TPA: DNA alkylation repair protein [Polyangiales bacterium]|nr:DNA alkylation repair protein [Polyangiales bacterium]